MKKLVLLFMLFIIFTGICSAEEARQSVVTRAQVIEKLSGADFVKKKIGDLMNFGLGYDISKINRTNLAPSISYIYATPIKLPPDDRTVLLLTAKVSDPKGPDNIKGVRADMSSINRLPNMMLVDNGLWGDTNSGDGIYSVQTSVGYDVTKGNKDIPVAVANRAGWVALSRTSIDVDPNPKVVSANIMPLTLPADGKTFGLLTAVIVNPGRPEDISSVTVDLSSIGGDNHTAIYDDGSHGDTARGDKTFATQVIVKQGTQGGQKRLKITVLNVGGGQGEGEITLSVQ